MSSRNPIQLTVMALCALSLAACSGGASHPKAAPPPPAVNSASEVEAIATLLDQGQEAAARKRLATLRKHDPLNASAQLLSDSLDRDPKDLLGPISYPYTVHPGDTIAGVAQHLLGNRLKAYQLGRYNGLKAPIVLVAGQTLRIPGEAERVEPVRRAEPVQAPPVAKAKPKPSAKPVVVGPAKPAVAPAANPAAARAARTAGLAALNQGNVARAVALLRHAAALDPANPLIAHDLARAERIAATVKARK